jgi:hypothetical protein
LRVQVSSIETKGDFVAIEVDVRSNAKCSTDSDVINRGDYDTASSSFNIAADLLECSGGDAMLIRELRHDSSRASSGDWDEMSTKKQWANRRAETKGRKTRYDD